MLPFDCFGTQHTKGFTKIVTIPTIREVQLATVPTPGESGSLFQAAGPNSDEPPQKSDKSALEGAEGTQSAFELLLALITAPSGPAPIVNASPDQTSSLIPVAYYFEKPSKEISASELSETQVVSITSATPVVVENLPSTDSVPQLSTDIKSTPQLPDPASGLLPTSTSEAISGSNVLDAAKQSSIQTQGTNTVVIPLSDETLFRPLKQQEPRPLENASSIKVPTPITVTRQSLTSPGADTTPVTAIVSTATNTEQLPVEQATTSGSVIAQLSEGIEQASASSRETPAGNQRPISDAVSSEVLETLDPRRHSEAESKALTTEVAEKSVVGRVHSSLLSAGSTIGTKPTRFALGEFHQFITNVSSSGVGANESAPDGFGQGFVSHSSLTHSTPDSTSSVANPLLINFEGAALSRNGISEIASRSEHHNQDETTSAISGITPPVQPEKVFASPVVSVSDQLAGAIVDRLDSANGSVPSTFRLRLDPRELGTVEVHLTIVHDVVSIQFVAQNEAARQIIEHQLDELRQSLTNSGVSFGGCHVGCNANDQHSPSQQEFTPPANPYQSTEPSRWARSRVIELPMTLPQGRLNVVA